MVSLRADEIKLWLTNQSLVIVCTQATAWFAICLQLVVTRDYFYWSLSFCRGSRVEGSMSRARVPCRGSRVTFFFLEKVIIDAINVIKTNKKNLKNKWRVNIF